MPDTTAVRQPLHKVIADMIKTASSTELEVLESLLQKGIIPDSHEEIVEAWENRCKELGWNFLQALDMSRGLFTHRDEQRAGRVVIHRPLEGKHEIY